MLKWIADPGGSRVIDERILPETFYNATQAHSFTSQACVFISFYFRAAERPTSEERQRTILITSGLRQESPSKRVVQDSFLTIDLDPFWKDVEEGLKRLQTAREMVESDPEILCLGGHLKSGHLWSLQNRPLWMA